MNYIRQLFQLETLVCTGRVEKFCPGTSIKLFLFALIHMINHNNLSVCGPRYLVFTATNESEIDDKSLLCNKYIRCNGNP